MTKFSPALHFWVGSGIVEADFVARWACLDHRRGLRPTYSEHDSADAWIHTRVSSSRGHMSHTDCTTYTLSSLTDSLRVESLSRSMAVYLHHRLCTFTAEVSQYLRFELGCHFELIRGDLLVSSAPVIVASIEIHLFGCFRILNSSAA